jgi:2-keto-4-pentenoate hydratase/2-oxohepta-3-ene-1,7-dioic acid hydratase in catechol pathway
MTQPYQVDWSTVKGEETSSEKRDLRSGIFRWPACGEPITVTGRFKEIVMRLVRVLTLDEKMVWGMEADDGSIRRVRGEPGVTPCTPGPRVTILKRLAPVEARVIFCAGLNYRRHAAETGVSIPDSPVIFMKNLSAVQHPGDPIQLPVFLPSDQVDYEGELAVVIGRTCKNVRRDHALD